MNMVPFCAPIEDEYYQKGLDRDMTIPYHLRWK